VSAEYPRTTTARTRRPQGRNRLPARHRSSIWLLPTCSPTTSCAAIPERVTDALELTPCFLPLRHAVRRNPAGCRIAAVCFQRAGDHRSWHYAGPCSIRALSAPGPPPICVALLIILTGKPFGPPTCTNERKSLRGLPGPQQRPCARAVAPSGRQLYQRLAFSTD